MCPESFPLKNGIVTFIFLFFGLSGFSQENENQYLYFTGIQVHYGLIISHTEYVEPISHTNPFGFELSFNRLHTSYEKWSIFRKFNISGIQLGYFNFQNPDIVGESYMLSVFTEPILLLRKKYLLTLKAGGGASWQTKIYHPEDNPLNMFVSTRLSFPVSISARLKYRISEHSLVIFSGCYNHISNGAMKLPNYGINFPTVSIGLEYFPHPLPEILKSHIAEPPVKMTDQFINVQVYTGYKVVYGEPTWSYGTSVRYSRHLRRSWSLNAGVELIFDGGVKRMLEIEDSDADDKRLAFTAGQELHLGKVNFTQYFGIYLYSPYKPLKPIYEKYELSYRLLPRFRAGVFLLAHGADADLFGMTVSYRLNLSSAHSPAR